jgi:uncharacterized OsmC-like protein
MSITASVGAQPRFARRRIDMPADPQVTARSTDQPGRFLVSARTAHMVADASAARGGTGEALVAAELFLASLAACGLAIVTDVARKRGSTLRSASVDTTYTIDPDDKTRFRRVAMHFRFAGIAPAEATSLVASFTESCPIYNTIARTTPTEVWGEAI